MDKDGQNPLARIERHKINYPLLIAAVLLGAMLIVGLVRAAIAKDLTTAVVFVFAAIILTAIVLMQIATDRRKDAVDDRKVINWDAAPPELQRENINIEVRELTRLLEAAPEQIADLQSAFILAGDLAFRQIQQEENLPLMRNVSIGKTPFDGILVDQDLITCVEVSFLVTPDVRQDKVESMLKKAAQAKKTLAEMKSHLRLRLMLVLVTQLDEDQEEQLRAVLGTRRFSETPVDIDIRILDFATLQELYLAE
jgi:hypothetical protein